MAQIIVWAKRDNENQDVFVNACKFKPGMVVDVLEDGANLGICLEHPWYRVIQAPGRAIEYAHLMTGDPIDWRTFKEEARFPRKRVNVLDLDALEQEAGILTPGDRTAGKITVNKAALSAKEAVRVKEENPLVFALPDEEASP